jgi:hypothetical protein
MWTKSLTMFVMFGYFDRLSADRKWLSFQTVPNFQIIASVHCYLLGSVYRQVVRIFYVTKIQMEIIFTLLEQIYSYIL